MICLLLLNLDYNDDDRTLKESITSHLHATEQAIEMALTLDFIGR
jgi:hypothetical protein